MVVALAAVLPATPRRVLAVALGMVLSVLVVGKVLDIGFFTAFDRPFNLIDDSGYAGIGIETLRNAIGGSSANVVVAVTAVPVALLAVPVLALLRVTRVAAGHREWALRAAIVLSVVCGPSERSARRPRPRARRPWLSTRSRPCGPAWRIEPYSPARSPTTVSVPLPATGCSQGCGADVLLVFVESYGRFAVQGPSIAPRIHAVLGARRLATRAAGFPRAAPPHLAHLRRPQLARAFHHAVGGPGRRPAAL